MFTAYATFGEVTVGTNDLLALNNVAMDLEGSAGPVTPSGGGIIFNHIVVPAILSLTNAKAYTNSSENYFDLKITYPETNAGKENVTITDFGFGGAMNANVTIVSEDGNVDYGTPGSLTPITLTKGQTIVLKLVPTVPLKNIDNPNDLQLTSVDYDVAKTPVASVTLSNAYATVGTSWINLRSSANIPM